LDAAVVLAAARPRTARATGCLGSGRSTTGAASKRLETGDPHGQAGRPGPDRVAIALPAAGPAEAHAAATARRLAARAPARQEQRDGRDVAAATRGRTRRARRARAAERARAVARGGPAAGCTRRARRP